jgi:hypothetical protein
MATIPVSLKFFDETRRALWAVNLIVLPEYRGHKLAKRLIQLAHETYCTTMIGLGYNEQSAPVLRSHKWVPLGSINRYHRQLFPGHSEKQLARFAPARHLVNLVFAPFRPSRADLLPDPNGELREVSSFDSSFDELWEEASAQWNCAVIRSSRFLEWQFMRQPGKKYQALGYYQGERLLGYVVIFMRKSGIGSGAPPKMAVSDLCYSPHNKEQVIDGLLKAALALALEKRAGGLVIDVLDPHVERRVERLGFWRIRNSPGFIAKSVDRQDLFYERSNWFLTRGDSDVSIFEQPNL